MGKNLTGGNKSKSYSSHDRKKKIVCVDPDFENSCFAIITSKPNGLMVGVKLILDNNSRKMIETNNIPLENNVYLGKLKNKRSDNLAPNDIVQVEYNFDMFRKNGDKYGYVMCKYNNLEVKLYRKAGLLTLDESKSDMDDLIGNEENSESEEQLNPSKDEKIDIDYL